MTAWQALYVKELKDNRGIFLFLLLVAFCLGAYSLLVSLGDAEPTGRMALVALPYLMALVFPFLLTHSFSQEFKGQTHYLLLSLPVPRWALVLSKFAAVLTGSAALFVVATIFLHAVFLRLLVILEADPHGRISYVGGSDLWVLAACGYFSITVLLLGIGTLVASVRLMVRRFQGLLAALCFVGCLYVYGRLLQPVVSRLDFLGTYDLTVIEKAAGAEEIQHAQPELQVLLYSCVMGLLFLGMGTWLIEKRVEA